MKPNLPLDQMSMEDKLQLMDALWDALSKRVDEIPAPDWHRAVVEERLRGLDAGEAELIPLEKLKSRGPR